MTSADHKETLHTYLRDVRAAMLWKLDGLSEYDVRRPLAPTGTNLLGLVKHLSMVESAYFGKAFDRPYPEPLPWWDDDAATNADLWVTEQEGRQEIVERYRRVAAHADAVIDDLTLDSPGLVPWWPQPDVTLHRILVHVLAETNRHAGHADVLREQLDGQSGVHPAFTNLPDRDAAWWQGHWARVEHAASQAARRS